MVAVSARDRNRDRGVPLREVRWYDDPQALASDPEVEAVVELIGGADGAALALVRAALGAGKSVVTANKALLAHHGAALADLAEANGATIGFEAAVAGGIPIVKTLREGLAGNRIERIYGILNGTCNYILTNMRQSGRAFDEVLAEAQRLGYAEADPSFDIDGIDAAHKLALLAALAFGCRPDFDAVHTEGIRHVSPLDIAFADEMGYRIKLLGVARRTEHGLEQRVHPCMVRLGEPISEIEGVLNAVVADADQVGSTLVRRTRRRRPADRLGGGRRSVRPGQGRAHAGVRGAEPHARAAARGTDGAPCRRLLFSADGGRPAGRAGRGRGLPARSRGLDRIADPAGAQSGRGGADRADDAPHHRGESDRRARDHQRAEHGAGAAAADPHRDAVRARPRCGGTARR